MKRFLYSFICSFITVFVYIPLIFLKVNITSRKKTIVLALYMNNTDSQFKYLDNNATHIYFNNLKQRRVVNKNFGLWVASLIHRMVKNRRHKVFVFNYRDILNLGRDLKEIFGTVYRVENGLLQSSYKKKFMSKKNYHSSYMIDSQSIYFDTRKRSDLEDKVNKLSLGYASTIDGFSKFKKSILKNNVTKYKFFNASANPAGADDLIIFGQCTGDQALEKADGDIKNNIDLVKAVYNKMPISKYKNIFYKPHPRNKFHDSDLKELERMQPDLAILSESHNPVLLLQNKPEVAVMTSGVGIEAAIRGCKTHCFSVSFYSNYGFTTDYVKCPRRTSKISADDLFAYVYCKYTRYIDVHKKKEIPFSEIKLSN